MKSINPYNLQLIEEFKEDSSEEVKAKIEKAHQVYLENRLNTVGSRAPLMKKVAGILRDNKEEYGRTMSLEMGKPVKEAYAEIEKCAWVCEYYAENAEAFLKDTSYVKVVKW